MPTAETSAPGPHVPPPIEWEHTYGGNLIDWGLCIQETSDGGYVISGARDRWIYSPWGGYVYLLKIDADGAEQWSRQYGSMDNESVGQCVQQTTDNGYIIAGFTGLTYHQDAYVLRTDSKGELLWSRVLGEEIYFDNSLCVRQTSDGGFVITGWASSFGAGSSDAWLVKLDADGETEWKRTYGGAESDGGDCVDQTADGGYVIAGTTHSFGASGGSDIWLIKTDSLGVKEWWKTFGGPYNDWGSSVQQTDDGGFIVVGTVLSCHDPNMDICLIKTDAEGNEQWLQIHGGSASDEGKSVVQTADGGYFITGNHVEPNRDDLDLYMIKTDCTGTEEWNYIIDHGGVTDSGYHGIQTTDGGYIVTGETGRYNLAAVDALVIKLEGSNSPPYTPSCPNPSDGATGVDTHTDLQWTGGDPDGDDVTYDVYFGIDGEPPLVQEDLLDPLYDPGTLDPQTTYLWRVVAADAYEATTEGPVWTFTTGGTASASSRDDSIGRAAVCLGSHPNPFGTRTRIELTLAEPMAIRVHICDITGTRIRSLVDCGVWPAGEKHLWWDGRDDGGRLVGSGVYFCRVEADGHSAQAKLMLLQ